MDTTLQTLPVRAAAIAAGLRAHPAALFQFDDRIRHGWLSDRYFPRAAATLRHAGRDPVVTMQVFAKHRGRLAGMYEALRLLETQLAPEYTIDQLRVESLCEGEAVAPWETVLRVTGPYRAFAHLETPVLGVLARRTLVATNVERNVRAANGKPVLFMGARHDDWRVQTADGYAAQVGGAQAVSSDAGGSWWGARGFGTMPHALIAAFDGDVVQATLAFTRCMSVEDPEVQIISLVDYHNDCVRDAVAVAAAMREEFGPGRLAGVRLDTSEKLVDESLIHDPATWGRESPTGVTPALVQRVRTALDAVDEHDVGVVVSGGFTPTKIGRFEEAGVPVMAYGVGSSLLGHNAGAADGLLNSYDFTADIVRVNGRPESKVGRPEQPNARLVAVTWEAA
jgi:nicotinate phosphoribosyltransferase